MNFRNSPRFLFRIGVVLAVLPSFAACGGGDDNKGANSTQAALSSCKDLCTAQSNGGCLFLLTADECAQFCDALLPNMPTDCQQKAKATSDCQLAQPNVCDTAAVDMACGAQQQASNACVMGGAPTNDGAGGSAGTSGSGSSGAAGSAMGGSGAMGCDTCAFANDGECDETDGFCQPGTDCTDCGT